MPWATSKPVSTQSMTLLENSLNALLLMDLPPPLPQGSLLHLFRLTEKTRKTMLPR